MRDTLLPSWAQRFIAGLLIAAGLFFTAAGAMRHIHGRALLDRGVVTRATLLSVGHRESDSDTGHQVRYSFDVNDRAYEPVGIFGTPVGVDVTADVLAQATATGQLDVRYLGENPTINEPVAVARTSAEKGLIAVGIGVFLLLVGAVRWLLTQRAVRGG